MTPPTPVAEAIARFLLATHPHPLQPDPARPWLRRPNPDACPDCHALADALGPEEGGR
jgi:hypothetical protein